jgi:hypothetical protein
MPDLRERLINGTVGSVLLHPVELHATEARRASGAGSDHYHALAGRP